MRTHTAIHRLVHQLACLLTHWLTHLQTYSLISLPLSLSPSLTLSLSLSHTHTHTHTLGWVIRGDPPSGERWHGDLRGRAPGARSAVERGGTDPLSPEQLTVWFNLYRKIINMLRIILKQIIPHMHMRLVTPVWFYSEIVTKNIVVWANDSQYSRSRPFAKGIKLILISDSKHTHMNI